MKIDIVLSSGNKVKLSDSVITPLYDSNKLRDIMVSGKVARLRCDWLNPKWEYQPRHVGKMANNPQTVTFNQVKRDDKGQKIPLFSWMKNYLKKINSTRAYNGWLDPKSGWINSGTNPEALSFGANDVIVKNIDGRFANVHAIDCRDETVKDTYFTENGRLVIHKFTTVTSRSTMIKMGSGLDAYMPFMKNSPEYWIPTAWLEFFPELPFRLSDGRYLAEYLLLGDDTWGITDNGDRVLLFTHDKGYLTNWKMSNPPPPPKA